MTDRDANVAALLEEAAPLASADGWEAIVGEAAPRMSRRWLAAGIPAGARLAVAVRLLTFAWPSAARGRKRAPTSLGRRGRRADSARCSGRQLGRNARRSPHGQAYARASRERGLVRCSDELDSEHLSLRWCRSERHRLATESPSVRRRTSRRSESSTEKRSSRGRRVSPGRVRCAACP